MVITPGKLPSQSRSHVEQALTIGSDLGDLLRCCCAGVCKVSAPSHTALHNSLRRYTPLIQVMAALEPQALAQLQQQASRVSLSRAAYFSAASVCLHIWFTHHMLRLCLLNAVSSAAVHAKEMSGKQQSLIVLLLCSLLNALHPSNQFDTAGCRCVKS